MRSIHLGSLYHMCGEQEQYYDAYELRFLVNVGESNLGFQAYQLILATTKSCTLNNFIMMNFFVERGRTMNKEDIQ